MTPKAASEQQQGQGACFSTYSAEPLTMLCVLCRLPLLSKIVCSAWLNSIMACPKQRLVVKAGSGKACLRYAYKQKTGIQ